MSVLYGNESIYLVARCCTISIISISFTEWGAHTWELYERMLITKAVYNAFRVDWILTSSVDLRMKLSILFALEAAASTWQFHFQSLHTKIPRSFWAPVRWTGMFWSLYDENERWVESSRAHARLSRFTSGSRPSSSRRVILRSLLLNRTTASWNLGSFKLGVGEGRTE